MSVAERTRGLSAGSRWLPRITVSQAATIALLAGICALPIAIYAPFFNEPFMRDEGIYAAVAQVIKHGGVPYRDAFDDKPPLLFAWYYLSFVLFGENLWAPRVFVALLLSGTTLLMYIEGRLLYSHRYGVMSAFIFALSLAIVRLETSANAEWFMLPPLVASLVTFTMGQRTGHWGWYAVSGFTAAVAIATKECAMFAYFLYIWLAAWPLARAHGWSALKTAAFRSSVGGLVAGGLLAFVLTIAPFVATGTMPDMLEGTVVWALLYVGGGSLLTKSLVVLTLPIYFAIILGPWFFLTVLGLVEQKRHSRESGVLIVCWLVANILGIIVIGKFYHHYYATLLPALALVMPMGIIFLQDRWRTLIQTRWAPATVVVAMFAALVTGGQIQTNAAIFLQPTMQERHVAKYHGDYHATWENQSPALGAWLAARTEPDDPIYNFGFQSEIYFYADRRSPTRFLMDRPFWYTDKYVNQALEELDANKPKYVVDNAIYETWEEEDDDNYTYAIKEWVVANYDYVGKVEYADVWRLKGTE